MNNWKYIKEDGTPEYIGEYIAGYQIIENGEPWCEPIPIFVFWNGNTFEVIDKRMEPNTAQAYIDSIFCYLDIEEIEVPEYRGEIK